MAEISPFWIFFQWKMSSDVNKTYLRLFLKMKTRILFFLRPGPRLFSQDRYQNFFRCISEIILLISCSPKSLVASWTVYQIGWTSKNFVELNQQDSSLVRVLHRQVWFGLSSTYTCCLPLLLGSVLSKTWILVWFGFGSISVSSVNVVCNRC